MSRLTPLQLLPVASARLGLPTTLEAEQEGDSSDVRRGPVSPTPLPPETAPHPAFATGLPYMPFQSRVKDSSQTGQDRRALRPHVGSRMGSPSHGAPSISNSPPSPSTSRIVLILQAGSSIYTTMIH